MLLVEFLSISLLLFLHSAIGGNVPTPELIFEFEDHIFIENIHARPNGQLFFGTLNSSNLYTIDPANPVPKVVANLNGSDGLTGIATIDAAADLFAVSGGIMAGFGFVPGSMSLYKIHCPPHQETCDVLSRMPSNGNLNGMTSIPGTPYILSADSVTGQIIRFNTDTLEVNITISDPVLGPGDTGFPFGVNGIKKFGAYLYFANSGNGTFGRIPINDEGNQVGVAEIMAVLPNLPAGIGNAYDDFTVDNEGNSYVTLHKNSVMKITPKGEQTYWVGKGSEGDYQGILDPTSATLSHDGCVVYICTTGDINLGATTPGGQIFAVAI